MNPLYKYPLIVLFVLVVVGLGFLLIRTLPHEVTETVAEMGAELLDDTPPGSSSSEPPGAAGRPAPLPLDNAAARPAASAAGTPQNSTIPAAASTLLQAAANRLRQTDLIGARKAAEAALAQPGMNLFTPEWRNAANLISQVNTELINSDAPAPEKVRYEVKRGDNLVNIARAHNTTVEALIRANKNLTGTSATIFPGMVFNIYRGDWSITVYKQQFLLIINDGERIFKVYDIAIGRQGRTPVGTFVIRDKLREPAWTPPGKVIPYGDPENVLGTRWLGLKPTGATDSTLKGYGIHGTWEPESIGSAASQGCVRMLNDHVNELFDIIPVGVPVTIKD